MDGRSLITLGQPHLLAGAAGLPAGSRRLEEFERHDAFYGIRRISEDAVAALGVACVRTAGRLDDEPELVAALLRIAARTAAGDRDRPVAPGPGPDTPAYRWVLGHQIFAVLTQGIILAAAEIGGAAPDTDIRAGLTTMAELFRASGLALRYTGRLTRRYYLGTIRPAMAPPRVPAGFSGLMARDHHELVRRLRALRPVLTAHLPTARLEIDAVRRAWADTYADHGHVCDRLVGRRRPSLLMGPRSPLPATASLAHYRALRLRHLACSSDDDVVIGCNPCSRCPASSGNSPVHSPMPGS